jgi:hypothetical protein
MKAAVYSLANEARVIREQISGNHTVHKSLPGLKGERNELPDIMDYGGQ